MRFPPCAPHPERSGLFLAAAATVLLLSLTTYAAAGTPDDSRTAEIALRGALGDGIAGVVADNPELRGSAATIGRMSRRGAPAAASGIDSLLERQLLAVLTKHDVGVSRAPTHVGSWRVRYEVLDQRMDVAESGSRLFGTARLERSFRAEIAIEVVDDAGLVVWSKAPVVARAADAVPYGDRESSESLLIVRRYSPGSDRTSTVLVIVAMLAAVLASVV